MSTMTGKVLVIYDLKRDQGTVYSLKPDDMYRIAYGLIMTRVGCRLDLAGYHRLEALGVSFEDAAFLLLARGGCGKTTLGFEMMKNPQVHWLTDDILVVDSSGRALAFPTSPRLIEGSIVPWLPPSVNLLKAPMPINPPKVQIPTAVDSAAGSSFREDQGDVSLHARAGRRTNDQASRVFRCLDGNLPERLRGKRIFKMAGLSAPESDRHFFFKMLRIQQIPTVSMLQNIMYCCIQQPFEKEMPVRTVADKPAVLKMRLPRIRSCKFPSRQRKIRLVLSLVLRPARACKETSP